MNKLTVSIAQEISVDWDEIVLIYVSDNVVSTSSDQVPARGHTKR